MLSVYSHTKSLSHTRAAAEPRAVRAPKVDRHSTASREVEIDNTTEENEKENTTAANIGYEAPLWQMADALRDTLLPKRISGELRVKDAERFLKEHGLWPTIHKGITDGLFA